MALCDLDFFKTVKQISSATAAKDAYYQALIHAASSVIEEYAGRKFNKATYTEYTDTNGTRRLPLRYRPVHSVTSVHLDFAGHFQQGEASSRFNSETLLTLGRDYVLDVDPDGISRNGILIKVDGVWPERHRVHEVGRVTADLTSAHGNVKAVYVGGYDDIPADLQLACIQTVSYLERTVPYGQNLVMEKLGTYLYKIGQTHMKAVPELTNVRRIISSYREVPW